MQLVFTLDRTGAWLQGHAIISTCYSKSSLSDHRMLGQMVFSFEVSGFSQCFQKPFRYLAAFLAIEISKEFPFIGMAVAVVLPSHLLMVRAYLPPGTTDRGALNLCQRHQFRRYGIENMIPIAFRTRSKQLHRRIPRAIGSIEQPKPMRIISKQYPDRLS